MVLFNDKTGQPRSGKELKEALETVISIMIKQPLVLPLFTVHAGIIKDALLELIKKRDSKRIDTQEFEAFTRWWKSQYADSPDWETFVLYEEWMTAGRPERKLMSGEGKTWYPTRSAGQQEAIEDTRKV